MSSSVVCRNLEALSTFQERELQGCVFSSPLTTPLMPIGQLSHCLSIQEMLVLCSCWPWRRGGTLELVACGLPAGSGGLQGPMNSRHSSGLAPLEDRFCGQLESDSTLEAPSSLPPEHPAAMTWLFSHPKVPGAITWGRRLTQSADGCLKSTQGHVTKVYDYQWWALSVLFESNPTSPDPCQKMGEEGAHFVLLNPPWSLGTQFIFLPAPLTSPSGLGGAAVNSQSLPSACPHPQTHIFQ